MSDKNILQRLKHKALSFPYVAKIVESSKKIILPGFDGVPLYDVIIFFFKGLVKGSLAIRASALAFNFFLALFPTILFLFTIIPFIPIDNFQSMLLDLIHGLIPPGTNDFVNATLEDIIARKYSSWLSVGFVLTIIFATNGVNSILTSFNNTFHNFESRAFWKQYFNSFILVFIIAFLLILTVFLISFEAAVLKILINAGFIKGGFTEILLRIGTWVVIVFLMFSIYSVLYFFGSRKQRSYRLITAGSTLAVILAIISFFGFNYYVSNFSKYNALYGSIGTLIILLVWLYFNSLILLLGYELNASIMYAKQIKAEREKV